ncbi:MAG: hypothetical protein Kow0010_00380 [Dehalococcoidia bacterium]
MTSRPSTTKNRTLTVPPAITVKEFGELAGVSPIEVIKRLMTHGVMAALNDTIDYETAALVAADLDLAIEPIEAGGQPAAADVSAELEAEDKAHLKPRPPVVTILGHVDHGKTSLLDKIRQTRVAAGEAGGITQHIGAYQVEHNGHKITFIDTPGHAAFTAMRARGAQVTDIAVLVVAADDGVMPQTVEAINHARAAGVPIIVAINKIDLPGANPDRVKQQLTEHNIVVEDYGGDVLAVPVSAQTGEGIDALLEAIELVAEISELKANPDRPAIGVVIEAELDTSRGPIATILVKTGTLRRGDVVVVGETWGKLKAMFDHRGNRVKSAGPSTPVQVMGLQDVPEAGERLDVVENERTARQIVDSRVREREATGETRRVSLDTIYADATTGGSKELLLILKTDVRGTAEAIRSSLENIGTGEVKVRVIHAATGPVSDSDVMLAEASNAIILAFNVRTDPSAARRAEASGVEIRTYDIIYQLMESVEQAVTGMYEPVYERRVDGHAEVRQIFKSSRLGQIAGSYVTDGSIRRNSKVSVLRGGKEIATTECSGLKRFQDDVREVQTGFECGIVLRDFDSFEEGDVIEFFHLERVN